VLLKAALQKHNLLLTYYSKVLLVRLDGHLSCPQPTALRVNVTAEILLLFTYFINYINTWNSGHLLLYPRSGAWSTFTWRSANNHTDSIMNSEWDFQGIYICHSSVRSVNSETCWRIIRSCLMTLNAALLLNMDWSDSSIKIKTRLQKSEPEIIARLETK
jgi:hypothetical protein